MNRAYCKWSDLGLTDIFFHICINELVVSEFADDLGSLSCPTFLSYSAAKKAGLVGVSRLCFILLGFFVGDRVIDTPDEPFSSGGTVTFVALNIGLLLGFKEITIVGLDHSFHDAGPANKTTTQIGVDKNHFFDNYFPSGMKWELPDLERSEQSFQLIFQKAKELGVKIIDETVDGKLTVFPKN